MRNRPRKINETVLSKQINRRIVKRQKYKDFSGLTEFQYTCNVIDLENIVKRFNLEDDGC